MSDLTVWVHELGHVIAGRLVGLRVTSVGTGTGGPVAWVRVCGTAFYAALRNPFQGLTFADDDTTQSRGKLAVYCCGGIAANVLAAGIVVGVVGLTPPRTWALSVWVFGVWNVLSAVASLWPTVFRVGPVTLGNDALLVVQLLTGRFRPASSAEAPNWLFVFGGLWRTIGERKRLGTMLLSAARWWAEHRNPGRAAEHLTEAESLLDPLSESERFHAGTTRTWIAVAAGDATEAKRMANAAVARLPCPGDELFVLWVDLDRADARARLNDRAGVAVILDRLAGHPGMDQFAYHRRAFDALAYRIGRTDTPPDGPPDDTPDSRLWLHSLLADRAAESGDWPEVERLVRIARGEINRMAAGLADPADRAALDPLREWAEFLLRQSATELGRDPTEEPSTPATAALDSVTTAHERRRYSMAIVVLVVGMVSVVVAGIEMASILGDKSRDRWVGFALLIYVVVGGGFGASAGLATAVFGLIRWRYPGHPFPYGTRLLTWSVVAFGVAVLIGLGVWMAEP